MKIHSARHYRVYKIDATNWGLHMRNFDKKTVEFQHDKVRCGETGLFGADVVLLVFSFSRREKVYLTCALKTSPSKHFFFSFDIIWAYSGRWCGGSGDEGSRRTKY